MDEIRLLRGILGGVGRLVGQLGGSSTARSRLPHRLREAATSGLSHKALQELTSATLQVREAGLSTNGIMTAREGQSTMVRLYCM